MDLPRHSGTEPARAYGYRPHLDGLRAIAIGGVFVYHLNAAWLPGGFLGVDLFFVLSGFLITTLLVGEHERSGRIDLPAFWGRRIRRLLPALVVLLLAVAGALLVMGDDLTRISARPDMLATLFYVANWQFIAEGQSYFVQYAAASPLRHTWSLAIEEQFYLLWPIVAGLVLSRFSRRGLGLAALVIAIASAITMSLLYDPIDPSRTYFGTDSRIFEILIGAILAVALSGVYRARVLRACRRLAWPGLVVIALFLLLLPDRAAFYYHGGALLFSLAVALVIGALEAGSSARHLLAWRPLVGVGTISYGLYLWHYPVIVFLGDAVGSTAAPGVALLAVAITAAISIASFVLIERPIRRDGRLLRLRLTPRRIAQVVPAVSAAAVAVILVSTATASDLPEWARSGSPAGTLSGTAASASGVRIGVVGDSVMVSLLPGLRATAAKQGWSLAEGAIPACPVGPGELFDAQGVPSPYNQRCQQVAALHDQVIGIRPQLILWHDLQSVQSRRAPDGTLLVTGTPAWTAAVVDSWRSELSRLLASGADVVIMVPALRSQDAPGCQGSTRQDRCLQLQSEDAAIRAATNAFRSQVGSTRRVQFVEIDELLCPGGYPCPAKIDGIAVRIVGWDQTHFTADGAAWFASRFMPSVAAIAGLRMTP